MLSLVWLRGSESCKAAWELLVFVFVQNLLALLLLSCYEYTNTAYKDCNDYDYPIDCDCCCSCFLASPS